MSRQIIDIVEIGLPYTNLLGALAFSLVLIRWIDRKGTMKFRALGVLLFVTLTAIGWGLISNPSSFLELRAILGLLVPAGGISTYLKLRYRISLLTTLKYSTMPLGFLVSACLMLDASFEQSKDSIIIAMFPSVLGALISALSLGARDSHPSIRCDRLDYSIFGATVLSCAIIVLGLYDPFFSLGPLLIFIGATSSIFIALGGNRSEVERTLEASLYGALLVIALNTIIYMDVGTPANTEQRQLLEQEHIEFMLKESPETAEYLINETDEQLAFETIERLLLPIMFALMLYSAATFVAIVSGKTDKLQRMNWHLAEGFVFIVFIFFAPYSLLSG